MLNNILIAESLAQESETTTEPNQPAFSFSSFVPLIAIFIIFYFLIIRPQSKKIKEHQEMVNALKIGNKVITSGGIIGVVKEVHQKEGQIEVEISEGVNIKILKQHVSDLVKNELKAEKNKSKK